MNVGSLSCELNALSAAAVQMAAAEEALERKEQEHQEQNEKQEEQCDGDENDDSFDFEKEEEEGKKDEWTVAVEKEAIRRLAVGRLIDGSSEECVGAKAAERVRALMEGRADPAGAVSAAPSQEIKKEEEEQLPRSGSPTWNGMGPDSEVGVLAQGGVAPQPRQYERQVVMGGRTQGGDIEMVRDGYNGLRNRTVEERRDSVIMGVRETNNFVKRALVEEFGQRGQNVLDLCCGKGGDLHKWTHVGPRCVVFADIAADSVAECERRYTEARGGRDPPRFEASFVVADCFGRDLLERLPPGLQYDVVSCQFALHYCFMTKERANCAMKTIARVLRPGGYLVCTVPDAEVLCRRLVATPPPSCTFGNNIYRVTFDSRTDFPAFGARYRFYLTEAVEDLPEYLVSQRHLCGLAECHGLRLVKTASFDEYLRELTANPRFRARAPRHPLTNEEHEVTSIYRVYAFRKQ